MSTPYVVKSAAQNVTKSAFSSSVKDRAAIASTT
ncbi:Uncharacterised protein [Mycobacteroides abscessus]|nr:Uncharacterised protein [Mycobacteroides abscessus]